MGYQSLLRLIQSLDPVAADIVNAPLTTLQQNAHYLWELLQAAATGSTVYAHKQTVEAGALEGMPVYYDPVSQSFLRGLATTSVNQSLGVVLTAPSAQIWGIVGNKINATLADILLFGVDKINISNAVVGGPPQPGVYYLSGNTPGLLTQQKPPVSVAVLRYIPDGRVFVMPQFIDFLDRHTHYKYALFCEPAGNTEPPAFGEPHVLTDPAPDLPGWLPADHPIFNGTAPPGAIFGYNLTEHPGLNGVWPPIPIASVDLEWDKGLTKDVGYTGVPAELCVIDSNGIWWMSNCYGDVPWPLDYTTGVSLSASESASECPRMLAMNMNLFFAKLDFATDASVVLSLTSLDQRIKVFCLNNPSQPGSQGNLGIALNLNLTVLNNQPGFQALKSFNPTTSEFAAGPITEGIYALSSNVTLSGDLINQVMIDDEQVSLYQGKIGISVNPASTAELDVQLVRLDGAREEYIGNPPLMYLEFEAGVQSDYRGKLDVPFDLAVPNPQLALSFQVLGLAEGTLPQLAFSARRVPRAPAGLATPLTVPDDAAEFTVTCNTSTALSADNQYVEADSEPFPIAPGDTVFFTVMRLATDAYAGSVGILRQCGLVSSANA